MGNAVVRLQGGGALRATPGTRSTPGVLEDLDRTIDGLCACGCGEVLDESGPSGWFASVDCQERFQRRGADVPPEDEVAALTRMVAALLEPDQTPVVPLRWTVRELEAIREWLIAHDVDPCVVPIDADFVRDEDGVWRVVVYEVNEAGAIVCPPFGGPPVRREVTFAERQPWPLDHGYCQQATLQVTFDGHDVGTVQALTVV